MCHVHKVNCCKCGWCVCGSYLRQGTEQKSRPGGLQVGIVVGFSS
jgi:hypothetical protein